MARTIFLITLDEDGLAQTRPSQDIYVGHVIKASGRAEARRIAMAKAADEGPDVWKYSKWSTVKAVGIAPGANESGIILSEDRFH